MAKGVNNSMTSLQDNTDLLGNQSPGTNTVSVLVIMVHIDDTQLVSLVLFFRGFVSESQSYNERGQGCDFRVTRSSGACGASGLLQNLALWPAKEGEGCQTPLDI